MQVILIKDVDNLGAAHEMVDVRPGYARNYLIPEKFAIEASGANTKVMEERRKQLQKKENKLMAEIANVTEVLKASPIKVGAKIEVQLNRDETIMRQMVTRLDKYAEAYNLRKRNKNASVENAS